MKNDDIIRGNLRLQDENQLCCMELEETNRKIVLLEEQNRELEGELDRFLTSDEDIRNKLGDKHRSPLKPADLAVSRYSPPREPSPVRPRQMHAQLVSEPHLLNVRAYSPAKLGTGYRPTSSVKPVMSPLRNKEQAPKYEGYKRV